MGAYACVCVHWGVGGTGNTKTRQRGGNYVLTGPTLGPMVGEISPNIMFCKTKSKWTQQTDPEGYSGVYKGVVGSGFTGTQENKEKRHKNRRSGHVFQSRERATKHHIVGKDSQGGQRGYRGGIMADQRASGVI